MSFLGRVDTLVDWRVMGSNPAKPPRRDLGKVLHLQLPIALRHVNSNTVPIAGVGSTSERLMLREVL